MKVVIQRVGHASVKTKDKLLGKIENGILVLVGIVPEDTDEDIRWIAKKINNLRIFNDANSVMNLSVKDIKGEILLVSQFTLHASTKKGNRPSYLEAAKPEIAIPIYQKLIKEIEKQLEKPIQTGKFGADMKIKLLNNGPITIIIDSKNKI